MGRYTSDAKTIAVFNRGLRIGTVTRLVFTGHSFSDISQAAAGVINYNGDVAVVHMDSEGILFIDIAESMARRGWKPLARKLISN